MDISSRLKVVLDSSGMNLKDFSLKLGLPYRTVQNYLHKENSISAAALEALYAKFGININWLLTGEGEMYAGSPMQEVFLNKKTGKPIAINELSDSLEMVRIELDRAREEIRRAQEIVGF